VYVLQLSGIGAFVLVLILLIIQFLAMIWVSACCAATFGRFVWQSVCSNRNGATFRDGDVAR
jgi:hypothetical protein